ncbi:MAG: 3-methyl-2-oxobutanoate hydroxymethyltransferase [Acidimicrobiales bacterium]
MARNTVPSIASRKVRDGSDPMVMITAYDAPSARMVSESGADMILVGDSVAMVVLGYEDTLQVTTDDMAHHTAAVARAKPDALIVGDLPWMSYHVSVKETVRNAAKLIRAGAQCVKLEGGRNRIPMVEALVAAEIPVMGHVGLTPQSVNAFGGFRVQAKSTEAALQLVEEAKALQHAGCFAIVVEGVPDVVANMVTNAIDIPTIGIGAGGGCDGQVLVFHDVLGIEDRFVPKFVRKYADINSASIEALSEFAADVRSGAFPNDDETYHVDDETADELALYGRAVD